MATPEGVDEYIGRVIQEHGLDSSLAEIPLLRGETVELGETIEATVRKDVPAHALDAALFRALAPAMRIERTIAYKAAIETDYDVPLNDIDNPHIWPGQLIGLGTGAGWHLSGDRVRDILTPRGILTGKLGSFAIRAVTPEGVPSPASFFKAETDPTNPGIALSALAFVIIGQYRSSPVAGAIGMQVRRAARQEGRPYHSGAVHTVANWMDDANQATIAIRELIEARHAKEIQHPITTAWETNRRTH